MERKFWRDFARREKRTGDHPWAAFVAACWAGQLAYGELHCGAVLGMENHGVLERKRGIAFGIYFTRRLVAPMFDHPPLDSDLYSLANRLRPDFLKFVRPEADYLSSVLKTAFRRREGLNGWIFQFQSTMVIGMLAREQRMDSAALSIPNTLP